MANCLDFTDLVLLIGKNPLPNYVAAEYFIEKNENLETVRLVYSQGDGNREGTYAYAKNLCDVLEVKTSKRGREIDFCVIGLEDISTATKIQRNILNHIKENKLDTKKLHLNYTGGTKAMAVHVYNTLKEKFSHGFSASYLDARDYKMKFDGDLYSDSDDLRETVTVEWDTLFEMHGFEKVSEQRTFVNKLNSGEKDAIRTSLIELGKAKKLHELKNFYDIANQGDNKLLDNPPQELDYERLIDSVLEKFTIDENSELFDFLSAAPEDVRLSDEKGNWVYENFRISNKQTSKRAGQYKEFLEGVWLEEYVSNVLKLNKSDIDITTNWKWKSGDSSKTFEIDVLIKNGYQLCGISCSTSMNEKTVKIKGFEIIHRTIQLGGDEAFSVLVTLRGRDKVRELAEDLFASMGSGNGNSIVLGIEDLSPDDLWKEIGGYIYGR